jgi:hemerythrin
MEPNGWTARLETGHEALDRQHRELFRVHAAAVEAARTGQAPAVREALQELLDSTHRHFGFEERLLLESGHPQREAHVGVHAAFTSDLVALVTAAAGDPCSPGVRLWLESRYASWWKFHVRSYDAALAAGIAKTLATSAAASPPAGRP